MATTTHHRGRRVARRDAAAVARYKATVTAVDDLPVPMVPTTCNRNPRHARRMVRAMLRTSTRTSTLIGA